MSESTAADRERAEYLLRAVTEATSAVAAPAFFSCLVKHIAQALRVRRVFVAECLPDNHAKSRAVWLDNEFVANFEYNVTGTPCMKVLTGETCLYSSNVREYFPQNQVLARLNAESYLGVPLFDSGRRIVGHMVIVDDKPMSTDPLWLSVLQTFAARAGIELERERAHEQLRAALAEVEALKNQLQAENVYLQEEIRREHNFEEMVGTSPALMALVQKVQRVAATDATVLVCGETGTGKELIARALHNSGARRERPLVKVNCGAVPASLLESELFGHVKGAFTGALERRVGRFELAHGGTLFLDEIGELPIETQVKLLRVLQEQEFEPVGSSKTMRVDVRIIAATNRDLSEEVKNGRFRSDLYFRLNVVPLTVPPLRDRIEDVPLLVAYFLERFSRKFGRTIEGVTRESMDRLLRYTWPGNIRELQNVVERAVVLSSGPRISLDAEVLPAEEGNARSARFAAPAGAAPAGAKSGAEWGTNVRASASPDPRIDSGAGGRAVGHAGNDAAVSAADGSPAPATLVSLTEAERRHIETALHQTHWVIEGPAGAARILDLHPNTLRSRMKKLGVVRPPTTHEIS